MISLLSIVAFEGSARVEYIDRSFGSFHQFYGPKFRHVVVDGSRKLAGQVSHYDRYGCEVYHHPIPYCSRLKIGLEKIDTEYLLFYPDDYTWIFRFPLEDAVRECQRAKIDELKLACRGMKWFSQPQATPQPWQLNGRVISGEQLTRDGDLFISRRHLRRDFHEQFSLGCHLIRTDFLRDVIRRVPDHVVSPGAVEKRAYLRLIFRRYRTAYYKMWIPAFHFIDKSVEGSHQWHKADDMLVQENFAKYNSQFNI